MKKGRHSYFDLIDQSYYFPQEGFDIKDGHLSFHGLSMKYLIDKYGTPFKLMYLPKISAQIRRAKNLFNRAIKKNNYGGSYHYSYCTKCCHFSHVLKKVCKEKVNIETSSSYDIDIVLKLFSEGHISKQTILIHNGYKTKQYLQKIIGLNEMGFKNSICVLDSKSEYTAIEKAIEDLDLTIKIGLRVATDEEPQNSYYTSRLGIRPTEVEDFTKSISGKNPKIELKMIHFFIDSGIKDTPYYWGEFQKVLSIYGTIKKICPSMKGINIGGGFPIRNNLGFEYDFEYIINEIVGSIREFCQTEELEEPDIFTEFGKYTVGESGAVIFSVLEQKQQNDREKWYIIDNSLMNTIPDAWSLSEKFILLPINKWSHSYDKVNIGGISCDHSDYYNSEDMNQQVYLPEYDDGDIDPLYIGFFHTGAYQDSISGYGGIKHCLIPSPKLIIVDRDDKGNYVDTVYRNEQSVEEMLEILGY